MAATVGQLRQQVSILYRYSEAPDATGQRAPVYREKCKTRARIEPISSRETERAKSFSGDTSHKVTIRWRSGIDRAMQIAFGSRTFLITGLVNPDERNIWLEIFCSEKT